MKEWTIRKKQLLTLFVFSLAGSAIAIIHGIFFDLKFSEIARLTAEGVIITSFVIFPLLLFMEWVFDWNNDERIAKLEKKLK